MLRSLAISAALAAASANAATPSRPSRLTTEYMLMMPDGVALHTIVDQPPFFPAGKRVPAVMERSPYGEDDIEMIALVFAEALDYISIRQDMRGTHKSNGTFGIWHDSVGDAYHTMDWIVQQPWSNGEVFTTGGSADCIDEYSQISNPHPALRGQFCIFGTTDGYGTFYPGGSYRMALIDGWLKDTVPDAAAAIEVFVQGQEQPNNPTGWWDNVNGSMWYQNTVNWPTVMWGGWYDIFQSGNFDALAGYRAGNGSYSNAGNVKAFWDPLGHCQQAADYFTHDTIFGRVLLPILMAFDFMADDSLTNKTIPPMPEGVGALTLYVMGAEENGAPGQYFTTLPDIPVPTPTTYYLQEGGVLSTSMPGAGPSSTTYIYDPANPVPTIGGDNLLIACGPLDQRPDESRPDVLIFTTDVLTTQVAISGGLHVTVYISTNVTDTDMVAKLIDVYPANSNDQKLANTSTLVADGIAKMKWRKFPSTNIPQPLSGNPSDVYQVDIFLWNSTYIFAPGHKIRVHISSSNYPRFLPNSNTGLPVNQSMGGPNITAQTTLWFDQTHPSAIVLPVVDAATQLPPFPVEEATRAMASQYEDSWAARREAAKAAGVELPAERDLPFYDWLVQRVERVSKDIRTRGFLAPHRWGSTTTTA